MSRPVNRRSFLGRAALALAALPHAFARVPALARLARGAQNEGPRDLALWYDRPAREWTEALPVGNGRLGAMVFGGTAEERLQLNEDTPPYSGHTTRAISSFSHMPPARS